MIEIKANKITLSPGKRQAANSMVGNKVNFPVIQKTQNISGQYSKGQSRHQMLASRMPAVISRNQISSAESNPKIKFPNIQK